MNFEHISVLLKECIDNLAIDPNGIYVDGTMGGGGHTEHILKKIDQGLVIGVDQDRDAIAATESRLKSFGKKFICVHSNFSEIHTVLKGLEIHSINGMLMDLGVSSYQLDEASRGFSYMHDGHLDMRMNQNQSFSAYDVVNDYTESELRHMIKQYGEEQWASRIAKFIVNARTEKTIKTTFELVEIIKAAIPLKARREGPHPAKRTFQAIRIEVNEELKIIEKTIDAIVPLLDRGGRLAIITFHSLEDRIVKQAYKKWAQGCICPPEFPICTCDNKPAVKIITRKPILPSDEEVESNPRSRSAKLRVLEKI